MFSPLFSHIFFYFIRFTASNDLLLSSKDNVSIFIGVTTGFPGMSPLSTCLNYFIMAATDFSSFFKMPAFADILLNKKFVVTFIKEYVLSFDFFLPHEYLPL